MRIVTFAASSHPARNNCGVYDQAGAEMALILYRNKVAQFAEIEEGGAPLRAEEAPDAVTPLAIVSQSSSIS